MNFLQALVLGLGATSAFSQNANRVQAQPFNNHADCSLPTMRLAADQWVKSHENALEACSKMPFDIDDCFRGVLKRGVIQKKFKDCVDQNPALANDHKLNRDALKILALEKATEDAVYKNLAHENTLQAIGKGFTAHSKQNKTKIDSEEL